MNFPGAEEEIRERLTEALALLNHLRATSPPPPAPLDDTQKGLRGLWLVLLYGAFERAINLIVEASIEEISGHGPRSIDCIPAIHSIFHYSMIQSVKDCSSNKLLDNSVALFSASLSEGRISSLENPLSERLQNVDGSTLTWVSSLFGAEAFTIEAPSAGRLRTLRERRNAVAHGRESANKVGERYTLDELARLYEVADSEIARFLLHLREHCSSRGYMRRVA